MSYSPIEIEEAKNLALAHGLQQIVIWHFNEGVGQHVTTWGEPMRHSLQAAEAGNHVKRAAGWPAEEALALPSSLRKMSGDQRVELVKLCAARMDNALAPLVAAGLVHPEIARIVLADLRASVLESAGASVQTWMELPRTTEAMRLVAVPVRDGEWKSPAKITVDVGDLEHRPIAAEPEPMGGA